MKGAGALVLAKTNMAEWAFSPDISIGSVFGVVRNPYDSDRSTAGSSGGTAAGVDFRVSVSAMCGMASKRILAESCLADGVRSSVDIHGLGQTFSFQTQLSNCGSATYRQGI